MKIRKVNTPIKILSILIFLCGFIYFNNNFLVVTKITVNSEKLPKEFQGYKIVQISDLHSKSFGNNQKELINKIKKVQPDIIVVTGDIIDQRRYNEETSIDFIHEAIKLAPIYYCTGNHEAWSGRFEQSLEKKLKAEGVNLLRNQNDVIDKGGAKIYILGVDDPDFNRELDSKIYNGNSVIGKEILKASSDISSNSYKMLLSHRPESFEVYEKSGVDLVLSGHAHGGQVRLPLMGGVVAPDQGLFPRFTAGKYQSGNTAMIVSRGLGNSIIPLRVFNLPEIVVITLQ
jgi:predicted MPP superfamily phosphohydrolase